MISEREGGCRGKEGGKGDRERECVCEGGRKREGARERERDGSINMLWFGAEKLAQ